MASEQSNEFKMAEAASRVSAALIKLQELEQKYAPFYGLSAAVDQLVVARHEYWAAYKEQSAQEQARQCVSSMLIMERTAKLHQYAALSGAISGRTSPEVIQASRDPKLNITESAWMQRAIESMHAQQDRELRDMAFELWPQLPP